MIFELRVIDVTKILTQKIWKKYMNELISNIITKVIAKEVFFFLADTTASLN